MSTSPLSAIWLANYSRVITWLEATSDIYDNNDGDISAFASSTGVFTNKRTLDDMERSDFVGRAAEDAPLHTRDIFVSTPSRCRSTSPTKRPRYLSDNHYGQDNVVAYANAPNNSPTKSEMSLLRSTISSTQSQSMSLYSTEETSIGIRSETSSNKGSEKSKRIALNKSTIPSVHFGLENYYKSRKKKTAYKSKMMRAFQSVLNELSIEDLPNAVEASAIEKPPMVVTSLIREFSIDKAIEGCVPDELRSWAVESSPQDYFPENCFDNGRDLLEHTDQESLLRLQERLKDILRDSHRLVATNQREEKWYPFVASVLDLDLDDADGLNIQDNEIKVHQVHGSAIRSDLLPKRRSWDGSPGNPIPTSKVDVLLYLNSKNTTVCQMLQKLREAIALSSEPGRSGSSADHNPVPFTFLSDSAENDLFPLCPVEVKTSFGRYAMASYQLAIAFCSQLTLLERLFPTAFDDPEDPIIVAGWTVIAHEWSIHFSYKAKDGNIVIAGPYNAGNTVTLLGLFKLLKVIETVKRWSIESFFGKILKHAMHRGWS